MKFTTEEKKKINQFLDKYEYLLEKGNYVTFLKVYREQNGRDALYDAFVDLIKETFDLNIEWFIKNDPHFYWADYVGRDSGITHVNIPIGVTTIPRSAFWYWSSLKSVTIPNSITTIGSGAFYKCTNLKTVSISENSQLPTIEEEAFFGCSSLTSIFIPNSVTKIGYFAFEGCDNLTIYCEASSKPRGWDSNWNYSNRPVVWGYKKNKSTKGN